MYLSEIYLKKISQKFFINQGIMLFRSKAGIKKQVLHVTEELNKLYLDLILDLMY